MTQSGQGEEPSARPAHEGIVLPSDGGEPLLPGMTGGPADRPAGPQQAAPGGRIPASAPPGGQAWGQPWGPDQHQAPAPPSGQGWQTPPTEAWGTPEPAPWTTPDTSPAVPSQPGPLPPEGAPGQAYGTDAQGAYGTYPTPGTGGDTYSTPTSGPGASLPPAGQGTHRRPAHGAALPPASGPDEGATQYIPPVASAPGNEGATQYLPPVAAGGDEGATQYLPPVGPGALPPEMPAGGSAQPSSETTQYLGRARQSAPGPLPSASGPDAEATQYIAPVPGQTPGAPYGDRQPPAEFDNLFRSGPGGDSPAAATQQLPRFQEPQPAGHAAQPSYDGPGPAGGRRAARDGGGRTGSRVPLIAACGIGIAVVGIGAGALLATGGGEEDKDPKTVSATAPTTGETSASPSVDPAEQQAIALDKLLADSGDSRTTVIKAVNDVKSCSNLAQAAKDLRDAAGQRNGLVTQLSELSVDKLPDNAALTAALNKAWKASAAADNHYAAWADQVAGQRGKLCKKGQARSTGQTAAGNRESGTASTQKAEAAKLWNAIAKTYGLTERQPTQL
ncbi:hypothetical protein StrepF001_00210 [Streptomyces sp. F001]|uniref:hypothetical protein n=1 Tax=Streptomyces sp. F001 TaxID=1510026 RepID=UPI00101E8555|nr:hypothetical protein [Streptomyces sp. F001]RZB19774.1 hypothetical protein StrepF001_00210 [Streptomyces sp. F001]